MNVYEKDHPHNAVFVAQLQSVIDGAPRVVQVYMDDSLVWDDIVNDGHGFPATKWLTGVKYRLKPLTVTRTLTYPEPLRVAPAVRTTVWIVHTYGRNGVDGGLWVETAYQLLALKRGQVFATESDAAEAARAIFGGEL